MPSDIDTTAIGLHALITDVYGEDRRVSDVLCRFGFTEDQVIILKTVKVAEFYENIKFALTCRFLHYSGGHRLLSILMRRYGLFGHIKETLESIGDSLGISCERARQLENKAVQRLIGSVSSDAVGIVIALAACRTLDIDAMGLLLTVKIKEHSDNEVAAPPDSLT